MLLLVFWGVFFFLLFVGFICRVFVFVLSGFLVANFYFSSPSLDMAGPYDPHILK